MRHGPPVNSIDLAFSSVIITNRQSQRFYTLRLMHSTAHRLSVEFPINKPEWGDLMAGAMHMERSAGVGILKATKARNAEAAIGQSEGLVTVLRLTQADLKPAEESIRIAKQMFNAHHYAKAFYAAKKAETLAISLDERYNGYLKAAKSLQARIGSMRHLGLATEALEKSIAKAEEKVMQGVWENGTFVPNYLEARGMVDQAEREGHKFQEKAERASNAIFVAEIAFEALVEMRGPPDPDAFANGVATPLEMALHEATKELAIGNADGARLIAQDIEKKSSLLRALYASANKSLDATDCHLTELRGEGILTERLESQIKMARDLLDKGLIEPGSAMATRLAREAKALGETYAKATTGLADAEILYTRLQTEGFQSYEAESAIRNARRAIHEGSYSRTIEHLEKALQAFLRRANAREGLQKAIEAMQGRVKVLQGSGLTFLPDIQDVLGRAVREFHTGNFSGSSEDLRLATVLLDQVTRAPAPSKK